MRSNILSSALAVSLENLGDGEEINPVTTETVIELDEVLEEAREAGDEAEGQDQAVDTLTDAADSLESLVVALESAVANGGLSPQSADIHSRAVANIVRRLPVDKDSYTLSVESFGGTGDKLVASQEALDGAKELLLKLWNGIKTAVLNAWKAVVNFVTTLGKSGDALVRAGKQLVAEAGQTKGNAAGKKVDGTAVAKQLHVSGAMKGTVGGALKVVVSNGQKIVTAAKVASAGLKELAGSIASGHFDQKEDRSKFVEKMMGAFPGDAMPGGKSITVSDGGFPKMVTNAQLKETSVEMAVPEIGEIKMIGQSVQQVGQFILDYNNKTFKDLQKEINAFIAKQDSLVKAAGFEKEETASVRAGLKEFKDFSSVARAVGPEYLSYAASAAKAAFGFGKKALAQYK